jgi:hypothetical protein
MNERTVEIIVRMGEFAANTRDDRLSNAVARVAKRLQDIDRPCEKPLTRQEQRIISLFMEPTERAA